MKSKEINKLGYFPSIYFDFTPKEIHKKEVYINLGIVGFSHPDFKILKESKFRMKNLKVRTKNPKELPGELELSESILSTLECIHVVLEYPD